MFFQIVFLNSVKRSILSVLLKNKNFYRAWRQWKSRKAKIQKYIRLFLTTAFIIILADAVMCYFKGKCFASKAFEVYCQNRHVIGICGGATKNHRMEEIRDICENAKDMKPPLQSTFLQVYDDQRIVFCYVPRVATRFWEDFWPRTTISDKHHIQLENEDEMPPYHKALNDYTRSQRRARMCSFTKVMFSREPLSRLWSAYNSKFVNPNPYYMVTYGTKIVAKYRKHHQYWHPKICGHDITFEEFLMFVVDEIRNDTLHHPAWTPQYRLCNPCKLQYDYIGKYETMEADAKRFLIEAGMHIHKAPLYNISNIIEEPPFIDIAHRKKHFPQPCHKLDIFMPGRWRYLKNIGLLGLDAQAPNLEPYLNKIFYPQIDAEVLQVVRKDLQFLGSEADTYVRQRRNQRLDQEIAKLPKDLLDTIIELFKYDYKLFNYDPTLL